MERWVDEADIDGFNAAYVTKPGTFVDLARLVVPELRRSGRIPHRRQRHTLREHLSGHGPYLTENPTRARRTVAPRYPADRVEWSPKRSLNATNN
ncbi:hypothetical protein HNP40_003373 [Mycobacteroides chelonae]|nr:hypothetical protein [Mycobacteroides chelonae]